MEERAAVAMAAARDLVTAARVVAREVTRVVVVRAATKAAVPASVAKHCMSPEKFGRTLLSQLLLAPAREDVSSMIHPL